MIRLLLTCIALNFLLVLPLWWRFGEIGSPLIAWEAWLITPVMQLIRPNNLRRWLAILLVGWLALVTMANLGDAATHTAFGRSLNLYLDVPLVRSIYHLLVGNVGQLAATFLMLLSGASLLGSLWMLLRLLLPAKSLSVRRASGTLAILMIVIAAGFAVSAANGKRLVAKSTLPAVNTTRFQWEQIVATHRARVAFSKQLQASPIAPSPLPGLLGRNVLLTFIESYGVSAIHDARYSSVVLPTLDDIQQRLDQSDLHAVSGLLEAPIRGGQSWLAHATALSGRWIDNQLWYRLMLESDHSTLISDFSSTGQRTLSVMPAITLAWPEGLAYGFDQIAAAKDIPYAGPPLNWVTMPDQFTLDYTQRHLLGDTPVFAQLALISSHAPWTPILPVFEDWSMIGDGRVFAPWEEAGDPPEVLWQDIERIRDHYAWSIDYSVKVTGRWAERVVDDNTLLIVLGDHQAAPLITGDNASAAVPVHVISGDPRLLTPFKARGFVDGMLPSLENPEGGAKMSQLRHWIQQDFGMPALISSWSTTGATP